MNGCRFITELTYDIKFKENYKIPELFRTDFQLIKINIAPPKALSATCS